jgi:neutral ceramidase
MSATASLMSDAVAPSSPLHVGVARGIITPPIGIPMVGFAGRGPSEGVHDDLTATALVLAAGEQRAAIVALDLLYLHDDLVERLRRAIAARTEVPAAHILLACSHTHYGPVLDPARNGGDSPLVPCYVEHLVHTVAGISAAAAARLAPCQLATGRAHVRIGINRRQRFPDGRIWLGQNPDGPIDPEVRVLRLDGEDGQPLAVLLNYACHPVSLGSQVRLLSADFPAWARQVLEQLVGGTVLFIQGAAGNINPLLMGPDWEHPRRLGYTLGAAAAQAALWAEPRQAVPLRVTRSVLDLPALLPESVEAGRRLVEQLEAERARLEAQQAPAGSLWWNRQRLERARRALAALEGGEPLPPVRAELQAIRLGECALVSVPGELFAEIGTAIKRASPFVVTCIAGYSNGSIGYIPTRRAYAEGGYEVTHACRIAPEAGEMIERAALGLLSRLAEP